MDLPDGEVRKLVENKDWAGMLIRDQVCFFQPPSLPPARPIRNTSTSYLLLTKDHSMGKFHLKIEIVEE